MKEAFYNGIEWLSRNPFIEKLSENEFCRGIIIGAIAGIMLILILRLVIWLCFRRKSCRTLEINNPAGRIVVNSGAVCSVLKYAARQIDCLEITRIRIFRRRKFIDIELRARLDAAKGTIPQIMDKLSAVVKEEMKNVFGVENIRHVKLNIASCVNDSEEEFIDIDDPREIITIKSAAGTGDTGNGNAEDGEK